MNYKERYEQWLNDEFFDEAIRRGLEAIKDEKEIENRFFEFCTGGLCGVMGAGTNSKNKYTIGKATMGLGRYLLDTYGAVVCKIIDAKKTYLCRSIRMMNTPKNTKVIMARLKCAMSLKPKKGQA